MENSDEDETRDEQDDASPNNSRIFVPPGARANRDARFGEEFDENFKVPWRLADKSSDLVEAVNDFHFAMINDTPRNDFYRECLRRAIVPGVSTVLELGTGSGLLAMIAARMGAKKVVAIEASVHMAELARRNIAANGLSDVITVVEGLSTKITAAEVRRAMRPNRHVVASIDATTKVEEEESLLPDVLVSELLGTLLLGESVLDYVEDARERLVVEGCKIVPPRGTQYAVLVECEDVDEITTARDWGGFKLNNVNVLRDTASLVFTKQYGFRFSSVKSRRLSEPIPVFAVDFATDRPGFMGHGEPHHIPLRSIAAGTAHCVVLYWEVSVGSPNPPTKTRPVSDTCREPAEWEEAAAPLIMSTCPIATETNFARDMQWGQGIQLLEDIAAADDASFGQRGSMGLPQPPVSFVVGHREALELECRLSTDSVVLQFELKRQHELTAASPTHTRFKVDDEDDLNSQVPTPSASTST